MLSSIEGYRVWAQTYGDSAHNTLMRVEQAVVLDQAGNVRGFSVLDVGTGPGRYRRLLAKRGAAQVVGIDRSLAMLIAGHSRGDRRPPGPAACGDGCALPFAPNSFDLVVAGLVVPDIAALDEFLSEAHRVLRPDGRIVYSDLHESWARNGWQRTFTGHDGRQFAIPYVARSAGDHRNALRDAGFSGITIQHVGLQPDVANDRLVNGTARPELTPTTRGKPVCTVLAATAESRAIGHRALRGQRSAGSR